MISQILTVAHDIGLRTVPREVGFEVKGAIDPVKEFHHALRRRSLELAKCEGAYASLIYRHDQLLGWVREDQIVILWRQRGREQLEMFTTQVDRHGPLERDGGYGRGGVVTGLEPGLRVGLAYKGGGIRENGSARRVIGI